MKEAKERQGYEEDGSEDKNCGNCAYRLNFLHIYCIEGDFRTTSTATCKEWRKRE